MKKISISIYFVAVILMVVFALKLADSNQKNNQQKQLASKDIAAFRSLLGESRLLHKSSFNTFSQVLEAISQNLSEHPDYSERDTWKSIWKEFKVTKPGTVLKIQAENSAANFSDAEIVFNRIYLSNRDLPVSLKEDFYKLKRNMEDYSLFIENTYNGSFSLNNIEKISEAEKESRELYAGIGLEMERMKK